MPNSLQVFLLLLVLFQVPTRISTFEINSNNINNRSIHHNKKTNSRRRRRRRRTSPSSALSVLSASALFSASATTTTSMTTMTMTTSTHRKHLILVGGGHAHVQVIKALNTASRPANVDVTLIDLQQSASYSGMVPGCVADLYTAEETLIHLKPLAAWAGITFLQGQVIDIDPNHCRMTVQPLAHAKNEGTTTTTLELEFDAVSMDIGSTSRGLLTTPGALTYTLPTRPISALVSRFEHETQTLLERVQQTTSTTANTAPPPPVVRIRVVVIGAGNAGLELAMATMGRWKTIVGDENITVTLLDSGSRLVPHETLPNQQALVQALADHSIHVRYNCGFVHKVREDRVILHNSNHPKENTSESKNENENADNEIPFDYCLWATGAEAHELAFELNKKHGLAITDRGWIRVNPYLQSISHPCIFAAGDCNTIENGTNKSPPKAGVYAVRSGPILIENLTKFLTTTDTTAPVLKAYTPQDDFLKLLVCGDGTALGFRFGIPFYGKWVFELKDTIDRNFMNLFKAENLPQLLHATEKTSSSSVLDTSQYDVSKQRRAPIPPTDAATLLQRHDDDVNFREAWDVIKDMSDDEHYRKAVLESYLK